MIITRRREIRRYTNRISDGDLVDVDESNDSDDDGYVDLDESGSGDESRKRMTVRLSEVVATEDRKR